MIRWLCVAILNSQFFISFLVDFLQRKHNIKAKRNHRSRINIALKRDTLALRYNSQFFVKFSDYFLNFPYTKSR